MLTLIVLGGAFKARQTGAKPNNGNDSMQSQKDLRIELQAIKWFALVRSDVNLGPRVAEFQTWFNADAAHSRAYRKVEALWTTIGGFSEAPEILAARRKTLGSSDLFEA